MKKMCEKSGKGIHQMSSAMSDAMGNSKSAVKYIKKRKPMKTMMFMLMAFGAVAAFLVMPKKHSVMNDLM